MSVSAVGAVATSMPRTYFFLKKKRKLLRHRLSRQHDKHSTVEDNGDVDENKSSDSEQDQLKFHLRKSESTTCVNTNDTVWNTFRCQHDLIKCPLCELSAAKTSRAVKSAAECNKIGYRRGCCAFADKYKDDCQNLIKTTKLAATICISHISCAATLASATSPTSNLSNCSCPKMQKCVQPTASKERKRTSPSWVPINKVPLSPRTHLGTTFITKLKIFDCRTNDNQILSIKATKQRPIKAAASSAKTALFANTLKVFQMFVLLLRMQKLLSFKTKGRQPPSLLSHQQKPSSALLRLTLIRNFETPVTSHTHHQQVQLQRHTAAKQRQHLQHIHLNCSVLYIVLIILSLMSLTMPATRAETSPQRVPLMSNENVCKSMDIRNTPSEFSQLRNCTVIEGFLLIVLLNTNNQAEFNESFPLLTEVTEFVIIYRVHYLRSLAQILPNLSVIRGRELFGGYALTIYSNPQLEELGLSNLIAISRGGVRIENNFSLCFVKTIDWSKLVTNTTDIRIEKNRPDIECPQCPGSLRYGGDEVVSAENDVVCKERQGRRFCWNSKTCQKFCPESCRDNCLDEHTCCNESCLGGCASNNLSVCNNCRRYTSNNTCIDVCPHGYYTYLDRRCITAEACTGSKFENNKQEQLVPYNGACSTRCPNGYNKLSGTCQFCGDKCQKLCPGGLIDSVERAKEYHGCTHITENGLTISISRGGRHLMEDLEFGLSSIKVIETYLKVHRTYGMFSLEYFKNLKEIKGKILCEDRFALYVLENNDLEGIWQPNQMVRIEEGRVFFHFNPKLCVSVIMALRPMLKHNATFDKNEVATDSNGSKGSCNTEFLNITIFKISHTMAIVDIVNPLVFEDDRTFIGYQYFYMEDKYKNATKHSNRPCDDVWMADEPTKETRHVYTSLKPFTQYAYYVKTMTISSEPRNAQSPIQYFKTKSAQPENVRIISSYANSSSEIVVTWLPPTHVYGHLTKYKLRAVLAPKNLEKESRNYCKDPLKEAAKIDQPMPHQATEKPAPNDCKCSKDGKGSGYDDEISDANIHDSIDFENMIQNFVYVKNSIRVYAPSKIPVIIPDVESGNTQHHRQRRSEIGDFDSFLLRHMRSLPAELNDNKSGTAAAPVQTATKSLLSDNDSNSYPNNSTRLDPSGRYFTVLVDEVNDTTTEFVFQNLKHFSVYELSVEACREPEEGATLKECSDVLPIYVRTMKRDDVDKVRNLRVKFENSNTTRSSIRLFWDPPESPNAAVVSYTISYEHQAQDAVEEKKCITELDYQNLTNGYTIFGLPTGNYSIRVRANSLAGEGVYSKYVYIYIPPTQLSSTVIAIICATVLSFLGLTVGFVVYLRKKILEPPSDLKMFPTVNPYYISMQYIPDDWEVPRERIIQLSALGQGSFGMVYEGILKGYNSSTEDTPCAIKTVNENATDRERMNFLNEASVMKQFDTYHVVRLLGVCSRGQPALVIMELMKNGDLKSYLRAHRPDEREDAMLRLMEVKVQPPPLSRIYQMAIEIADGMAYLAAKKFVHRDLAARNCMVASDLTVKIGDFGMTRDIYETDYYRKGTKGLLPVRWMPPESLRDGIYSTASDVFSYGVVLWEMATLASQPYQGLSNDQVLRYVIDGGIMERPENCPDKLYRLMQKCWHHRPTARPSFMEIIEILLEHANSHFTEVSFYHSEDGQVARNKEIQEKMHQSIDEFKDNENDMDDVTTPLRVGEYNEYKLNIDISSIENQNESPTITDLPHTHSPYSHGSANINNSTPGNPTLSSAPSTSAGIVSSSNFACRLHQSLQHHVPARLPLLSHSDEAAYVQPDYEPRDLTEEDEIRIARDISKGTDTDEFGYQLYDPSPTYGKHHTSCGPESAVSAQNLLPKQRNRQRLLASMSSSMPDEAVNTPMSSLQPSFYSAASSNISSNATSGNVGGVGKCPTLKKAISETVQSVGISLPQRLRNMNLIFLHKRSGSNTSRKSCGSNPNSVSSNSNLSSTRGSDGMSGQRNSVSGSNLNTIESGENAGSYAPTTPLFLKRDNPNYKLLDESIGSLGVSVVDGGTGGSIHPQPNSAVITTYKPRSGFNSNIQHSYKVLNESLNTSDSPKLSIGVSENPTHELLLRPPTTNDNPNYVMMSEPQASTELQGAGTSLQTGNFIGSQKPLEYNEDEVLTEGMDLEHISLYPSRSVDPFRLRDRRESINQSRSRGRSQGRIQEVEDATSASTSKSAGHQLKEKWLQHQQNQNRLPPSNGLIGRDS